MAAGQRRERVGRPQPLHVVRPRAGSVGPRPCGIVARASRPLPPLRAAGEPALRHRGSARGRVVRCRRRALRIVGANGRLPGARVHPHGCGVGGPGHVHHSERVCGGGLRAVAGVHLVHARTARGRVLGGQPVLGLGASGRRGGAGRHRRRGGRRVPSSPGEGEGEGESVRTRAIPFGPAIAAATAFTLLAGPTILTWYAGLF